MRVLSTIKIALIAFSFATFATVSELKVFEFWSQVSTFWESEINPMEIIGHPHMPRYLVTYPGFIMEELLPSIGFSLYIAVFFAFNVVLLREVTLLTIQRRPSIGIYLCFAAIHLAMNGRGVIAWTAWLICIWICHKISMKLFHGGTQIIWIGICCLLASVSTGVFIVIALALTFVVLSQLQFTKNISLIRLFFVLILMMPVGYVVLQYFFIAIKKNLDFFGGGFEAIFIMLEHGLGVILNEINILSILIIFLIAIVALFTILTKPNFSLVEKLMLLAISAGLFGILMLTLAIPLILIKMQRIKITIFDVEKYRQCERRGKVIQSQK
jgi:hypothetical protein